MYARRLAERGWDLTLVARREHRLTALAGDLRTNGRDVRTLSADLGRDEDLDRVAHEVAGGDVALLVNNAGINGYGPFAEADPDLVQRVLAVNVVAPTTLGRPLCRACWSAGAGPWSTWPRCWRSRARCRPARCRTARRTPGPRAIS